MSYLAVRVEADRSVTAYGERRRPRSSRRHADEHAIALCDGVIDISAAMFGIPSRELRRTKRSSPAVTQTRYIAMYVAHVALGLSMREVGLGFSRDRTLVVRACHLIEDMRDDIKFDGLVALAERIVSAAFLGGQEG